MQSVKTNLFLNYASNFNFSRSSGEIKVLVLENIKTIAQNALTEGYLNGVKMSAVIPISLNLKTLTFTPPKSYLVKNYSTAEYITSFMPAFVSKSLGYDFIPDDQIDDSAENIQHFFDFLATYVGELASLEVGDEREHFAIHFLNQYKSLSMGLYYLSESYRFCGRNLDSILVTKAIEALGPLSASFALVEGLSTEKFYVCTRSFLSIREALKVLEVKKYADLKKMMQLRKHAYAAPIFKKKLLNRELDFLAACMRMNERELDKFCLKLKGIIYCQHGVSKTDLFFAELLCDAHFSSLHELCLIKLLRRQSFKEDQEQFEKRARGQYVQLAWEHLNNKIQELKSISTPANDKALTDLFKTYNSCLSLFQPFQKLQLVSQQ